MTAQPNDEAVERVLELSDRVFRHLLPLVPTELLRIDLTMTQLKVVLLLYLNGPLRMSAIASPLGVSLATATGVVDRLVEKRLVSRDVDPNDRRVVMCRLSDKGEDLTTVLWRSARERARQLLSAMPASRLRMLNEAMDSLLQAGTTIQPEHEHQQAEGGHHD